MINESYLRDMRKQFAKYKQMGEKTMEQLTDEQLFWQANADSNSIAVIVKHLWGNMLSRWTDFLTSDGEKVWRQRDEEFENNLQNRQSLMNKWEEGWQCLFEGLETVKSDDLEKTITIRNEDHLVLEAIDRQVTHCAYHVGQIVVLAKMMVGEHWKSLSIPKGQSKAFNQEKFSQ